MLQKVDAAHLNRMRVADYLNELDPSDFDMGSGDNCICGHVSRAFMGRLDSHWLENRTAAADFLGISSDQVQDLFCPDGFSKMRATPQQAARVMRHLAATDEVDWSLGR